MYFSTVVRNKEADMKKIQKRSLRVNSETVRELRASQLDSVDGGVGARWEKRSVDYSCQFTENCA
jgi:hypothetical protein